MIVAVIGCGPAGLAAAHAAAGLGLAVDIYAPKRKTPQRGPLLLQRPIPGINTSHPDGTIRQIVIGGGILDYRYRLYGDINIGISGDILRPFYHAWRFPEAYDRLWDMYEDNITDYTLSSEELARWHEGYDLVVSTANARQLCRNGAHQFSYKEVLVTSGPSYPDQPDNTIIFNGGTRYPWVRSSKVFGVGSTEWVPGTCENGVAIWKPISTDCNCYPHVLRTGRFGSWRNETWVDTAYWDTYSALASVMNEIPEIGVIS